MSRSAQINLSFAGEDRLFCLNIGRLQALDALLSCGPMVLYERFLTGQWRVNELRETIQQGLIGGGMETTPAAKLMATGFDGLPLLQFVPLAQAIVGAVLFGDVELLPEKEVGEVEKTPSPTDASVSPDSMGSEPL